MTGWQLMLLLNHAHNSGQEELSSLILSLDFDGKRLAREQAVVLFEVNDYNILKNTKAATKLCGFDDKGMSYKTKLRLEYLRSQLKRIGDEYGL